MSVAPDKLGGNIDEVRLRPEVLSVRHETPGACYFWRFQEQGVVVAPPYAASYAHQVAAKAIVPGGRHAAQPAPPLQQRRGLAEMARPFRLAAHRSSEELISAEAVDRFRVRAH